MGLYVQEFLTEAELANYKYPETSEIIETDAPTQPVTTKAETTKAETKPAVTSACRRRTRASLTTCARYVSVFSARAVWRF